MLFINSKTLWKINGRQGRGQWNRNYQKPAFRSIILFWALTTMSGGTLYFWLCCKFWKLSWPIPKHLLSSSVAGFNKQECRLGKDLQKFLFLWALTSIAIIPTIQQGKSAKRWHQSTLALPRRPFSQGKSSTILSYYYGFIRTTYCARLQGEN